MQSVFRKTGVKIAMFLLCAVLLTAAAFGAAGLWMLLSSGAYENTGSLFEKLARQQMWSDMEDVLHGYFDPEDPTHPWESYYAGGLYTGHDSNFVYTITDAEGNAVLSTYDGVSDVLVTTTDFTTYMRNDVVELVEAFDLDSQVFSVGNLTFAYNVSEDRFEELSAETAAFITAAPTLPGEVFVTGFSYHGQHYTYAEEDFSFFPEELYQEIQSIETTYTITAYLLNGLPYRDAYRTLSDLCGLLTACRYDLIVAAGVCGVLGLVLLILLCCYVAWLPGAGAPELSPILQVPTDVGLFLYAIVATACLGSMPGFYYIREYAYALTLDVALGLILVSISVYLLLLLCARIKTKTLFSGSFLYWCWAHAGRVFRWIGRALKKVLGYLPLVWKVLVIYGAVSLMELFLMAAWNVDVESVFLWFLERLFGGAVILYVTLAFRRLKSGAETIAAGDYTTKVSEKHLVLDFKDTADTLNHIQDGMNAAVDSRIKSERLKTELITNVSHDLKTPLTSIVSYVDLLKQELSHTQAVSQEAENYIDVLDRQSQRLKKLIEDLVEASKASTGNLNLQLEPLDFNLLLNQALGEYAQKLMEADLTLIQKLPEEPVMVQADGRRLWRVFDNLLGNAVKYAMPGTRLYLNVTVGSSVTATFRNITREPLEVSAQELMERFVRGDASRHTEGSGLGLSIARSLTESMGGSFDLDVDGDLFKVMVTLPVLPALPPAEQA